MEISSLLNLCTLHTSQVYCASHNPEPSLMVIGVHIKFETFVSLLYQEIVSYVMPQGNQPSCLFIPKVKLSSYHVAEQPPPCPGVN